jgi:transposase-like protein
MYAHGHATPDIARAIGVNPSTVRRWVRAKGVKYGSALSVAPPPESLEEIKNPSKPAPTQTQVLDSAMNTPTQRLLNAEQIMAAIGEALERPGDAANRYQAVMVALGLNMLKTSAAMPPAVKTIKDLATLNDIIRTNLGLNAKGGSGGLSINLNVLTKEGKGKTADVVVEAETV